MKYLSARPFDTYLIHTAYFFSGRANPAYKSCYIEPSWEMLFVHGDCLTGHSLHIAYGCHSLKPREVLSLILRPSADTHKIHISL